MNDEQRKLVGATRPDALRHELELVQDACCALDAEGHCVTCSDKALPARVLKVDQDSDQALVLVKDTVEEIDITLVDSVVPGDMLLVHGGVAIAHQGEANDE